MCLPLLVFQPLVLSQQTGMPVDGPELMHAYYA
jgi:hypothetical protein